MEYVANALLSVHRPYGAHSSQDSTALQIQPGETSPDWVHDEEIKALLDRGLIAPRCSTEP